MSWVSLWRDAHTDRACQVCDREWRVITPSLFGKHFSWTKAPNFCPFCGVALRFESGTDIPISMPA